MQNILKSLLQSKSFSLKAAGNSMLPILRSGDVVHYRKMSIKNIKINDLVLVKKKSKLFTHRVIYKEIPRPVYPEQSRRARDDRGGGFLITKGDNNPESDGKIYPQNVVAKVQSVKRNGKEFDPNQIYLLQSSLYFQEIIKIKSLFERHNIDFVYLKGLPLHLYYEGEHPRRIYADCDVLVNKNDFQRAEKILLKQGYKKQDSPLSKGQKHMKDKESELAYYKIINGFMVTFDLHIEVVFMMTQLGRLEALYPQKLINKLTEECLRTKRQVKIHNEFFQILDTKYLILYLALHFFHHNYRGAFRLEFLDKVIRKNKPNTELINLPAGKAGQLIDTVKFYRLHNFVYPTFLLLKKYYQTPIPQNFLAKIKPTNPLIRESVNSLIKTNIFDDEPRIGAGITRFKNLFFLSPEPLWRKMMIVFNQQVLYTGVWLIVQKIMTSSLRRQGSSLKIQ